MGGGELEKKVFLQNEPNSSFRINKNSGFALGSIGFDRLKKPPESQAKPLEAIDRGVRQWKSPGRENNSPWQQAPLREMLQREAGGAQTGVFTKQSQQVF